MSPTRFEDDVGEETPFIPVDDPVPRKPTQLPTAQISILLSLWIAEAVVEHSITPYINQLVRELPIVGGDGRKVGYYTGIILSLHHAAEAIFALPWNRLSDHVGRKPVLLSCLAGTIVSIISFGLSRSFWALAFSRCLHGALKGDIGTVKSMMAELTDETNVARGFSLLPMTWALGYVVGPFIGGILSRPQDRWPHVFSHPFWATYPYFLPCLVVAAYACLSFVAVAMFLEETMNVTSSTEFQSTRTNRDAPLEDSSDVLNASQKAAQEPLPLRSVLTRAVVISVVNYAMLSFLEMISLALIPLIWSTPIEFGGLDMSPASIGLWISAYGVMDGIFQFAFFPRIVGRFGPRLVFLTSIAAYAIIYTMFPFENLALRHAAVGGPTVIVWLLVFLQLWSLGVSNMGYSAVFMFICAAAPNQRSLGATNGFAQTLASVQRAVGPAAADWLFAFTLMHNILGGKFIYVVLLVLVCVALAIAAQLPRRIGKHGGK
ncbi:MFS general substrate transporter [Lactifluus subvellereus]|nr:MFS general substrate transporter [Lactifluus subvellereus]